MEPAAATLFPASAVGSRAGVLPRQHLRHLIQQGVISASAPIEDAQIQPASLDLRLGTKAWRVAASFLPGPGTTVLKRIEDLRIYGLDLTTPKVLEKGYVYIVPLMESVRLPRTYCGRANPKSTTGRLDVFTRLLTDHCAEYEFVDTEYSGPLYVEIVPLNFSVVVQAGTSLNQLRIIRGGRADPDVDLSDTSLEELDRKERLVYDRQANPLRATIWDGLTLSIDLKGDGPDDVVGFRARKANRPIDLAKRGHYDPKTYWEPIPGGDSRTLTLFPNDFYILATKERVRVPLEYAARLVEIDPSYGEFRVHYAGFFDPGFGYGRNDVLGTIGVLEVRSHDVPFQMTDGQIVARLKYERLVEKPDKVYGAEIGSSYQKQGVALSKQFKKLP
jgi:dCTP deaminase